MKGDFIKHIIHISGKRMIEYGVEGLSRSCPTERIVQIEYMLSILPLHRSAIGRSLGLVSWIRLSYLDKEPFVYLNSNGWDTNDFSRVNYVWVPPPVTADTTLEQLCRNVHLYPENCRIVCIIRLMMGIWRTLLMKVSDCFLTIPYDEYVWSSCNFEPLILSIILSRHSYFHYKVKYSIFVRLYERNLQRV